MYIYVPDRLATNPPVLVVAHHCGGSASGVFGQAQGGGIVAAADQWIPQASAWKRISSPARTFILMMGAALAGLSVFFVPARSLWKVTSAGADSIPDRK